jgi:hypothetical protein
MQKIELTDPVAKRTKPLKDFSLRGFAIFKAAPSYSPTV